MNPQFAPLFQPYCFNNGVTIKNRLVVAPMTHYSSNPDGSISEQERLFLQDRATDFGLFITAATLVSPEGKAFIGQPEAIAEKDLPSLQAVADIIRSQGAKAILQIHHGGKRSISELLNGLNKRAPSSEGDSLELRHDEIEKLIAAYGKATELAIQAGFDGVELHGANGYLIQQFFSPQTNRRCDQWGGSLENRLRFPLAVTDAVLAAKAKYQRDDFIIGYRFSPEENGELGLTMADTFALIDALVERPLQYLHVSLWDFYRKARRGADTEKTRIQLIHQRINGKLPLIGVGCLFTAEQALAAFNTGWSEFIGFGKAVIINPNFATLITQNRQDEIKTTIDLTRKDRYRLPDQLWQLQQQGGAWLPPIQGREWKTMDI